MKPNLIRKHRVKYFFKRRMKDVEMSHQKTVQFWRASNTPFTFADGGTNMQKARLKCNLGNNFCPKMSMIRYVNSKNFRKYI